MPHRTDSSPSRSRLYQSLLVGSCADAISRCPIGNARCRSPATWKHIQGESWQRFTGDTGIEPATNGLEGRTENTDKVPLYIHLDCSRRSAVTNLVT